MYKRWGNLKYAEITDAGNSGGSTPPAVVPEANALFDNPANAGSGTPASATPPGAVASNVNGGGKTVEVSESWKDSLPDDIKNQAWLKNIKTVDNLAKSYQHAQSLVGADKIPVPTKNSSPDDWKNVYTKLGLPEKAEDYKLDLPKDLDLDMDAVKALTPILHANGILPHQAKALIEWLGENDKDASKKYADNIQAESTAKLMLLKQEWGSSYAEEISKARAATHEYLNPEDLAKFKEAGYGNDPVIIKLLAKVGASLSEDKIIGAGGTFNGMPTPAQAKVEAASIMQDPKSPYWDSNHPGHKELKTKVETLFKISASV